MLFCFLPTLIVDIHTLNSSLFSPRIVANSSLNKVATGCPKKSRQKMLNDVIG